jgi:hypothetical protein
MNIINKMENFSIDGVWYHWGEMTPEQKAKKIKIKIQIAEACGDKKMEDYWKNVLID